MTLTYLKDESLQLSSFQFDDMVTLVLRSEDELLHVTLYSWFISEGMADKLVEVCMYYYYLYIIVWNTTDPQIQSPYIEEYLKQTAAIQVLHVHVLS